MVMRLSFSVDPTLVDIIDQYAKKCSIKREEAILELIEAGVTHVQEGGIIKIEQKRSFEDIIVIKKEMNELKDIILNMERELRTMHHTIEKDINEEARVVPFQSKKWWEFWKS